MVSNGVLPLSSDWRVLCVCVAVILFQCQLISANDVVQPPGRFKRSSVVDPVQDFLEAVKTDAVDLIILMERSRDVGRYRFYLRARKLVSHVMRYYIKLGPSNVRLVLATFATDFTVHMDGLKNNITKCQIWDEHWDNVTLVDTPGIWSMVHVKRAYEQARDIFTTYNSPSREKYIWLLTSGNYRMDSSIYNPRPIAATLRNMGVQIVATKVGGLEGYNENIREVVSSFQHHGGEVQDWVVTLKRVVEITDATDLVRSSTSALCHCEQSFGFTICGGCLNQPCEPGTMCSHDCICTAFGPSYLCPKANTRKVCPFYSGQTGRYCEIKVIECVRGTCANNGTCHEHPNSYTCTCPPAYEPEYLCDGPRVTTTTTTTHVYPSDTTIGNASVVGQAVGGSMGALILVIIIIIIIVVGCCIWRKRRRPETRDAATYTTQSQPKPSSTLSSLNVLDLFKRRRGIQTPSDTSSGSYLEMQNVPPSLPSSLPPPTVRNLSRKSRTSLRKLLQYIPEHLHPSTHQVEVERAVSVINVGNQGAAAVGGDGEDDGDYENVGSRKMPGWEGYVTRLATEGGLRNFAIVKYDRDAYVTTCEIWLLPSQDELTHMYNVMLSRHTGVYVKIKEARYKVTKNNGKMLESWLEGRTPDVLCIGRSKQYLTLGVETDRANTGNCYQEVSWVRDNLSRQGK